MNYDMLSMLGNDMFLIIDVLVRKIEYLVGIKFVSDICFLFFENLFLFYKDINDLLFRREERRI